MCICAYHIAAATLQLSLSSVVVSHTLSVHARGMHAGLACGNATLFFGCGFALRPGLAMPLALALLVLCLRLYFYFGVGFALTIAFIVALALLWLALLLQWFWLCFS